MARVDNRTTRVLHVDCGEQMAGNDVTELQLLECHGMQYLARRGFPAAQRWLDQSPLTKTRNAYGELV